MPVLPAVEAVVATLPKSDQSGWQAQLALQLAGSLDEQPNASMARELRSVMHELQESSVNIEEDDLDKIISLNTKRKSASSG